MSIVSRFSVFYFPDAQPGGKFRQVVARAADDEAGFVVRISEGTVLQREPEWSRSAVKLAVLKFATQEEANARADLECGKCITEGWQPYDWTM